MNVKAIRRENMRALAKSVGGINGLALRLSKAQSQISHLIGVSPIKNIGSKIAAQVEAVFNKAPGWLDRQHHSIEEVHGDYCTEEGRLAALCQQIPFITWQEASEWNKLAYCYKPKTPEQLMVTSADISSFAFALRVHGDSMESVSGISFPDGAVIVADPDQVAKHGSFVVVSINQNKEAGLKQLVSDGNKRYLKPLNPRYPIVEFTVNATIYAVVKQVLMNF